MGKLIDDGEGVGLGPGETDEAANFFGAGELGGDQQAADAAGGHRLGFADGGNTDADGPGGALAASDVHALVGLGVGAERESGGARVGGELGDVGLEGVEIQEKRGRGQVGFGQSGEALPAGKTFVDLGAGVAAGGVTGDDMGSGERGDGGGRGGDGRAAEKGAAGERGGTHTSQHGGPTGGGE